MGTKLIFFGFLFLINPDIITLDPIPDFFGYLLIAKGLYKLSFLEERIALARKYAFFLAGTSLLKLFSSGITFGTRIESTRLTVCFLFLVAELAFSFFFCDNALKGIQYLAMRRNGDIALKSYDLVKGFVMSFFGLKAFVNFSPVLPVIFFSNIDADGDLVENYTQMRASFGFVRGILFVVGALLLAFLGVYTALIILAYIKRLKEDASFATAIREFYGEKVSRNLSLKTRLAIKDCFFWMFLSFVFLGDLYLDFVNMFFRPLFALFIFFGLKRISPYVEMKKSYRTIALLSFFVTLAVYGYRLYFVIVDKGFPYTFPSSYIAAAVGILGGVFTIIPFVLAVSSIEKVTGKYTTASYKKQKNILIVLGCLLTFLSFLQYFFVGRSDLVVALEWIFLAVLLYLHKTSLDDIRAEAEYKLM